jgi:uncharacterized membrane protein
MFAIAAAFVAALVTLVVLDLVWLTTVMGAIFRSTLGDVVLNRPRLIPAGMFYLIYAMGVTYFAIIPSAGMTQALVRGAAFGLVAYATYDLTNLSSLRAWTWSLSGIDIAWGTVMTGLSAMTGFGLVRSIGLR